MKIIGKTKEGFILEAKAREVARLTGYYSEYTDKLKLEPGKEIQVHEMYDQLYNLSHAKKEIISVQNTLRSIANDLDEIVPVTITIPKDG